MSMKSLVNSHEIHTAFIDFLNDKIKILQTSLEQATAPETVYRLQGQITALRRLLKIRDEVNHQEK